MLNKDFYPTPKSVVDLMISGVDYQNKILLDPSAGKGDILDAVDTGKWYSVNDNFDIRFYKKGTMHIRFTDENTWMSINREYSKAKGFVLPSNI